MANKPIEKSEVQARQGARSGRVIIVLLASLALGLIAMVALLGYFYSSQSPPG